MAVIRTPNGLVDDTGSPLQMAKQDIPNVGNAVIANAPAATLTPQPAAAQPPPAPSSTPVGAPVVANAPTPSPQATTARPATSRGPTSGVSTPVDDALIRAKADAQVQQANDQLSPTTLVLNYLQSKGLPRTSENVRLALEANARDPTTIKGLQSPVSLINEPPPTETAPTGGGRGGGSPTKSAPPAQTTNTPVVTPTSPTGGANDMGDLVPQLARAILRGPGGPGPGTNLPPTNLGPPNAPAPVTPQPSPTNPSLRSGAAAIPPPSAGNAVVRSPTPQPPTPMSTEAQYVGRAPIQPSGRMIDQPGVALPPPEEGTQSAIERAVRPELQGPTRPLALPALTTPTNPQLPAPATTSNPRLPAPPIQFSNPRMGAGAAAQGAAALRNARGGLPALILNNLPIPQILRDQLGIPRGG